MLKLTIPHSTSDILGGRGLLLSFQNPCRVWCSIMTSFCGSRTDSKSTEGTRSRRLSWYVGESEALSFHSAASNNRFTDSLQTNCQLVEMQQFPKQV